MRSALVRLPVALLTIIAVACSSDKSITAPDSPGDAITAADAFSRLADSVAITMGEDAALAYRDAADQIRSAGQLSRIAITIDGNTEPWIAVAGERVLNVNCLSDVAGTTLEGPCVRRPILSRSLIAWRGSDPRRLLFLTAPSEEGSIGPFSMPTPAVFVPAFLQLVEGRDRFWVGTSGKYASTVKTGAACASPAALAVPELTEVKCTQAEFTWTLDATLEPARDLRVANAARVTHTIAFSKAVVAGTHVEVTFSPREPRPLTASLSATVNPAGDDVTLAFTVRNETALPRELHFNSTQLYDFRITTRGGETLWTWSATRDFAATMTTHVLQPHSAVTFTEHWKPSAHGQLLASARLTARELAILAIVPLSVP